MITARDYAAYLNRVAAAVGAVPARSVLLTHLLPDRPVLLAALDRVARVAGVIAIPYSIDEQTLTEVARTIPVTTPTLDELDDPSYVSQTLGGMVDDQPFLVVEIGGYLASGIVDLKREYGDQLAGVVEDTEAGHRRYSELSELPVRVVSVARSRVKEPEDLVVGRSCLFSTERILRSFGDVLEERRVMVIGFGKVGFGLALALRDRGIRPVVWDRDPVQMARAAALGCRVIERSLALQTSDLVFGATGATSVTAADLPLLRDRCVLVSCSSRDVEFDLSGLSNAGDTHAVSTEVDRIRVDNRMIFVLRRGRPVNFADGAVLGSVLTLTQGGLIAGVKEVWTGKERHGLFGLSDEAEQLVAGIWIDCNGEAG